MVLDGIDRQILFHLQHDGRKSNRELSEIVGLSASSTLERVKKLEELDVIEGYAARVNPTKVGRGTIAIVAVSMAHHDSDGINGFWKGIRELPQVLEAYHVSGESDCLMKVMVKDLEAFEDFLLHHLTGLPNIGRVTSSFVLSTVKYGTALPIEGLESERPKNETNRRRTGGPEAGRKS